MAAPSPRTQGEGKVSPSSRLSSGQSVRMEHDSLHNQQSPTPEEFEEARQRELARLNVRVSSITGQTSHTTGDLKLLKGDTPHQRLLDMDVVRRWTAGSEKYGGGRKLA